MTIYELQQLQALPLEIKILKTKQRIREFIHYFGGVDNVYISFSGGKDSTVLKYIAEEEYPGIKSVFVDTGLEYPEIKEFIKSFKNVETIHPKISFLEVIKKYGYPLISKEQSQFIEQFRNAKSEKTKNTRLNGNKNGVGKISEKWKYLINAPFKISDRCCFVMKKEPFKRYEKQTGRKPILGVMAEESSLRQQEYLKNGCNAFDKKRETSKPLGFWTEQDILKYIKEKNIKVAKCYGELKEEQGLFGGNGKLYFTGTPRTGCMYCLYGIHLENGLNRMQKMKISHPKIYCYCINNLKIGEVLDYIGVKY
jgi:3'-phosphoadenosine 5'-phosphosulfate sulfotransferase (PAPS reductase)/FAD synthetase